MRSSARRQYISFQNARAKSKDGQFQSWQKLPKINWLPWQRPLDYCETYGSLIVCMHASTTAETLVKTGSAVVEIFGDIGQFRPSHSTSFIFLENENVYPTLSQKLLNQFSPFFTRRRAISGAINARIRMTIAYPVLKCQVAECRSFRKFCPKLVAMATTWDIKKKARSVIYTQNAFIWWKDCENWSSRSWDNLSPRNH